MSNQTEVLTWLEKCKLKVGYSGMPRNAQRAFELGFDEGQAPLLAEIEFKNKIIEQHVRKLAACHEQRKAANAEIERLNNLFESIKQASHDTNGYTNKVISERDQLQDKCVLLQQQLDSLKAKVSEHNEKMLEECNSCGYTVKSDCFCSKEYMIDMGEHHE